MIVIKEKENRYIKNNTQKKNSRYMKKLKKYALFKGKYEIS